MTRRPIDWPLVFVFVFVGCLVGVVAVAGPVAGAEGAIELENTVSQSETPDRIDVVTRVSLPDSTVELEITLPDGVEVRETDGFRRVDDRTYEWTGTTRTPSVSYEYEGTVRGTRHDREGYFFVVTEEWALVRTPGIDVSGRAAPGTEITRSNVVDGEGIASSHMAYLGPYAEHTGAAAGQEFRLVVPEAADLREDPEAILDTLEGAAERLTIGEPTDEVFVIAAPTAEHTWAPAGLQRGDGGDMWVQDTQRLGTVRDTWIHEYVHTRQRYVTTPETRWTIEGMADYYAALLPYEAGEITYEAFRDRLEEGTAPAYDGVRLAEPDTWAGTDADYDRGSVVFAHLDRRLRADADTTLDAVVADVNDPGRELTQRRFLRAIESAGGTAVRADAERYTETTDVPPIATRSEHVEAFGGPDVRVGISETTVSGPYRSGEIDLEERDLVVGETLELAVTVENVGTDVGPFEAELLVDGAVAATELGELEPGESTVRQLSHSFAAPGVFELAVGTDRRTVFVAEPAGIEVVGLEIEPSSVAVGEPITVRTTVESAADRPADGELSVAVDGETVATESVRVGDGTTTVETAIEFEAPGTYTVSVDGRSASVTVDEPSDVGSEPTAPAPSQPILEDQPGFTPAIAIVAIVIALGATRRR